jgi:DNA-binding beta-propeller fold protein YncE
MRSLLSLVAFLLIAATSAQAFEAEFVTSSDPILSNPHDVELSADGKLLYVSDLGNDRVAVLGTGRAGKGANVFTTPEGVVIRDQDLWISDSGNNRVVRYRIQ